jgi:poly(3-hydroxybutyrate) depolymerase
MRLERFGQLTTFGMAALVVAAVVAGSTAQQQATKPVAPAASIEKTGRADPSFAQPSLAPGVDYTVPTEADIKSVLDRVRDYFVTNTPYRIIDTLTVQQCSRSTGVRCRP